MLIVIDLNIIFKRYFIPHSTVCVAIKRIEFGMNTTYTYDKEMFSMKTEYIEYNLKYSNM